MSKKILILPGDGIGQEVTSSALQILEFIVDKFNLDFSTKILDVGGTAYEKFGSPIPEDVLVSAKEADAILFGAVGAPKWDSLEWDKRPEQALLTLRKELDLFANLRPAFLFNELADASSLKKGVIEDLDILIVRELTGGLYFGEPRGIDKSVTPAFGFNTMRYDADEINRIAKIAFEASQKRKNKVCSVDKANVLEVSRFWRETVTDLHNKNFSSQELSHMLADNAAMQLVIDPNQFDVILASNLFGDILSDIAATLTGSIGMLPSASLDSSFKGMYEPCHGSAPDIAQQDIANPLAMIGSLSMALKYSLGEEMVASKIDLAIKNLIKQGFRTKDISNGENYLKTSEVAQKIIENIENE